MLITGENLIRYWAAEPVRDPVKDCCIRIGGICLPDLATLSPEEKKILRPVLERHPEYLLEVWSSR